MFPSKTASDNNSISDSSSLAPSQSSLNITSLRPDCLNNLRFPSQSTSQKTHLLAFMSEFMEEK